MNELFDKIDALGREAAEYLRETNRPSGGELKRLVIARWGIKMSPYTADRIMDVVSRLW